MNTGHLYKPRVAFFCECQSIYSLLNVGKGNLLGIARPFYGKWKSIPEFIGYFLSIPTVMCWKLGCYLAV